MKNNKEALFYKNALIDLRAPISEQIAALNCFLKNTNIKQEEKDLIELSMKSCYFTKEIIDIVEEFYKINNKTFKLDYQDFDFFELIEEVVDELKIIFKYEKTNIIYKSRGNFIIKADKNMLKIALKWFFYELLNYVGTSDIFIDFKKIKNKLKFTLSTNGRHIQKESLFDKYKINSNCFLKSSQNLGMYLVKEIIIKHYGQLEFNSNIGCNSLGFIIPT